ncbi:MAG: cache domain-containing protein [Geobacteraceae bacterium]|nr:cache domain-containing protein [Geobacteraceae bacterium]
MYQLLNNFLRRLKLRSKMLVMVLPLVIIPIILVGGITGYIANHHAYLGITQTSKDDLEHMSSFTIDLLQSHHQQFQVYKQDKERIFRQELAALATLSYNLVETQYRQAVVGRIDRDRALQEARNALKKVNVGESGYIYAMTGEGSLKVHIAREGENVYNEKDENGRYFIREMCQKARHSKPGEVLYIIYPWRNAALGDKKARNKIVAYRYLREWDWIIAAGGYLEETYDNESFERSSFGLLKEKLKQKKVGTTGYIFCMDSKGNFKIHPSGEGKNFIDATGDDGKKFIKEMCEKKSGWIRYPWRNKGEPSPRMKIVRYDYFEPWDWIVAVGSYEDEFYNEANKIRWRILAWMLFLSLVVGVGATLMVILASRTFSDPINRMLESIRQVKRGRLDVRVEINSEDELGELGAAFNRMTEIIQRNREMEATLAQHGKMASLGVLSSGVAHEINNPLGVILGYAGYLEGKMSEDDPGYKYIHEIKRESKRCKKIVQDLLNYARTPKPVLKTTNINSLLEQIVDFAANHTDMHNVRVVMDFDKSIPPVMLDGDQMRQVAINLILNAGAAMGAGGLLTVSTMVRGDHVVITFRDNGEGIDKENLEKIFEPFFTTKEKGTGLGLAITKQIVEQHHGRIIIESEVGDGTTVTVQLPFEPEEF